MAKETIDGRTGLKALAIVGSYRDGGIIDTTVAEILRGAKSKGAITEKVMLKELQIGYCRNCRTCTQQPDVHVGRCKQRDEMEGLIERCLAADILVLASPVNVGLVTAVFKTFMERLAPLVYWPWGNAAPRSRAAVKGKKRRAVLVTSSAAPAFVSRLMGMNPLGTLNTMLDSFNAQRIGSFHLGMVAMRQNQRLSARQRKAAFRLGAAAVDPGALSAGDRLELAIAANFTDIKLVDIPIVGRLLRSD
jgi:multimeric flavodoxin WrbA